MRWGDRWLSGGDGPPTVLVHGPCGHELDQTFVCWACEQTFAPTAIRSRPGPGSPDATTERETTCAIRTQPARHARCLTSWPRPAAIRDRAHGTRVTYSPKVFIPLTMLCRDRCGYCTFAQPPARLAAPYLTPDEVLAIARRGAARGLPRGAVHPGRAARAAATTWPGGGSTTTATTRPSHYLRGHGPARARRDRPAPPRQRRRPRTPTSWLRCGRCRPSQGMMIESLEPRPGLPPRRARQGPGAPPGHARGRRRAGHPVHHRHPRRHRREPRRPHRRARRRSPTPTGATATCRR